MPKSVSVEFAAARAAGDEVRATELVGAMTDSVEAAVAEIQELVPLGRLWDPAAEVQRAVPAGVAALLDVHSAARPVRGQTSGDPHLHVHCRILNLGLQQGGQVASVNYWMLYQNIRPLNSLFEAGLRSRLETLGYATVDSTHGERREWASFELGRQDAELSAALSARTEHVQMLALQEWEGRQAELLASLQLARALQGAMGIAGEPVLDLTQAERDLCRPTPREVSALSRASRERKLATTRAELAQEWGRVCAAHGYHHQPSDPSEPPAGRTRSAGAGRWRGSAGMRSPRTVWSPAGRCSTAPTSSSTWHLGRCAGGSTRQRCGVWWGGSRRGRRGCRRPSTNPWAPSPRRSRWPWSGRPSRGRSTSPARRR